MHQADWLLSAQGLQDFIAIDHMLVIHIDQQNVCVANLKVAGFRMRNVVHDEVPNQWGEQFSEQSLLDFVGAYDPDPHAAAPCAFFWALI
ncbi:Hypothetical protein (plasmid) [Pseudomonas putida]|nr:Hypothetical protein [Pseudomonas putida]